MKIRNIVFPLVTAALVVCAVPARRVSEAGRAPMYVEGVCASEITLREDSPVVVEKEELIFRPEKGSEWTQFEEYGASYTAEYILYNPSSEDAVLKLGLPLNLPRDFSDEITAEKVAERCALTANGKKVAGNLRFNFDADLAAETTDAFYSPDLPVREYECTVDLPESCRNSRCLLRLECSYNPDKTRFITPEVCGSDFENGALTIEFLLSEPRQTLRFAVFGEPIRIASCEVWEIYFSAESERFIASAAYDVIKETTLAEHIRGYFPNDIEMREEEAFLFAVSNFEHAAHGVLNGWVEDIDPDRIPRRIEYEILVPSGERTAHAVTVPLFPSYSEGSRTFSYDFSAAWDWAEFGELSIAVQTDSEYEFFSRFDFKETDGGFVHIRDFLPMERLQFQLNDISPVGGGGLSELEVAFLILGVLAAVAVVIIAVCFVRRRRKLRAADGSSQQVGRTDRE